jgi:hypothetical protein
MYQVHRNLNPLSALGHMLAEYQSMYLSTRKRFETFRPIFMNLSIKSRHYGSGQFYLCIF